MFVGEQLVVRSALYRSVTAFLYLQININCMATAIITNTIVTNDKTGYPLTNDSTIAINSPTTQEAGILSSFSISKIIFSLVILLTYSDYRFQVTLHR